ncbi:GDSL-type esterase/lipase family protein [Nocardioides ungokensis]
MTWGRRAGLGFVSLALLGATLASSDPEAAKPAVRILLVGDSVTQGSSGDWTWRYRLWQHLVSSGVRVDLVGPYEDLFDNVTSTQGSDAYLDPVFDRDHAARWGMAFGDESPPVGDLVRRYHPDVVVEMLGVNDLGWRHAPPAAVDELARRFVADARAGDPGVDVVLGEVAQTWVPGAPEYDASLPALAADLTTGASRVVAAAPAAPLVQGVDTYDAAHPTATGEVKLAAGVGDALSVLGIGPHSPWPLPVVPNGPRVPATLTASPGDGEVMLSWQSPPGATAEYVWIRDATTGEAWTRLPDPVTGTSWTSGGLTNGDSYEFRLQAEKGSVAAEDLYSDVVTATPTPAP